MICSENDVKILWTQHFFLIPQISATIIFFFLPFSAMPLPQLLQKFFFPILAMALPQLVCQFFFSFHFEHSTHTGSKIGHRKFGIPVTEIQHFFSPPFSSSLSYFWLNFGNDNTEINLSPQKTWQKVMGIFVDSFFFFSFFFP